MRGYAAFQSGPVKCQDTPVCVRTHPGMEQQSDHNRVTPFGTELLDCGDKGILTPWSSLEFVPSEVKVNGFAVRGPFYPLELRC